MYMYIVRKMFLIKYAEDPTLGSETLADNAFYVIHINYCTTAIESRGEAEWNNFFRGRIISNIQWLTCMVGRSGHKSINNGETNSKYSPH
jgi:hypothetical protein